MVGFIGFVLYAVILIVKGKENTIDGYPEYGAQNSLDYDYHDDFTKRTGSNILSKRHLGPDSFDNPNYYGTGYGSSNGVSRQGGTGFGGSVDPQFVAGTGLLSVIGAVGTLGTLIQAQQIIDIRNEQNQRNSQIDRLAASEEAIQVTITTLQAEIEELRRLIPDDPITIQRSGTLAADIEENKEEVEKNEERITESEDDIRNCKTSVASLCSFANSLNSGLSGIAMSTMTTLGQTPINDNANNLILQDGVTATNVRNEFNRIIMVLNSLMARNLNCNSCSI